MLARIRCLLRQGADPAGGLGTLKSVSSTPCMAMESAAIGVQYFSIVCLRPRTGWNIGLVGVARREGSRSGTPKHALPQMFANPARADIENTSRTSVCSQACLWNAMQSTKAQHQHRSSAALFQHATNTTHPAAAFTSPARPLPRSFKGELGWRRRLGRNASKAMSGRG